MNSVNSLPHPDELALWASVCVDPYVCPVLADWYDEHDKPELAAYLRTPEAVELVKSSAHFGAEKVRDYVNLTLAMRAIMPTVTKAFGTTVKRATGAMISVAEMFRPTARSMAESMQWIVDEPPADATGSVDLPPDPSPV